MKLILFSFLLIVHATFGYAIDSLRVHLKEGTNVAAALSPDKTKIAFDLQGTLWLMPVTGGTAIAITDNLGDCRQPQWSPDGQNIVFQSYRDGGWHLWTISPDGSQQKQLTFGIYDDREPQWSGDGKHIIFSSDRTGNYDIWEMEVSASLFTQITHDPKNDYYPAYSTDGRIAFVSDRNGNPGIFIRTMDGSELEQVSVSGTISSPSWTPDAKSLVFQSVSGGEAHLSLVNIETKQISLVTDVREDVFPFRTQWLSDKEALYTADGVIKKLDIITKKAGVIPFDAVVTLSRLPYARKKYDFNISLPQEAKGIMGPSLSPDGSKIVFASLGNLYLLNIGNPVPEKITHNVFVNIHQSWSPDGKKIVYASDRLGKSLDLWVHNLETHDDLRLTNSPDNEEYPSWSPDGKSIAFFSSSNGGPGPGSILNVIELSSREIKKIHDPIMTPGFPGWSADGKYLMLSTLMTFSSRYREGVNKVLVISLQGGPDKIYSPMEGQSLAARARNGPLWSPDGKWIVYTQGGILWRMLVNASGLPDGAPRQLSNELAESPTWSGDSQSILYQAAGQLKLIHLVDGAVETIPLQLDYSYQQPTSARKIIHAGRLFDGKNNKYHQNVDIVLEGNRIKEVIPHVTHGSAEVTDATGMTVLPGLMDMHTHQFESAGERLGRTWLAFGITTVRETGDEPYDVLLRKETWNSGIRPGPRDFITGGLQDGSRIYYKEANSISIGNSTLELDRVQKLEFDLLKTYVRLPDNLQKRFTAFAHMLGIPITSHEIYPSASYGVDALEHVGATSRRGYSPVKSLTGRTYEDVLELLTKSGMTITPTVALYGGFNLLAYKDSTLLNDPTYLSMYSEIFRSNYRQFVKAGQQNIKATKLFVAGMQKTIVSLVERGNHITAGTDAPLLPFGLGLHAEMQVYVDGGLSPYHALQSATLWAAESLGVQDHLGSIEAGKVADIIIVQGDPLKNIKDALKVKHVFKNGIYYSRDKLLKGN